jgi:hypothetical protein
MLQVFYLDIAYVAMAYTYVASVYFKMFHLFLQVFYLDVTDVSVAIHICYKRLFKIHLFQTYAANVFIWMLQLLYTCYKCMFINVSPI